MESAEQAARPRKLNVSKSSRAPRLAVFERDFQKLDRDEARPLHLDLLPAMSAGPSSVARILHHVCAVDQDLPGPRSRPDWPSFADQLYRVLGNDCTDLSSGEQCHTAALILQNPVHYWAAYDNIMGLTGFSLPW